LVIIGGLNLGLYGSLGINVIEKINLSDSKVMSNIIFIVIGLAALYLAIKRDTYLPFLGKSAFPGPILNDYHNFDTLTKQIKITDPDAIKVVYWAAGEGQTVADSPEDAYTKSNFENSGVVPIETTQNKERVATIYFKCPRQYKVMNGLKTLPRHIHYRLIYGNGLLSEVNTINIDKC